MNKISQSEIARRIGLSHQSFNQMLSAADVKTSLLEKIAAALGKKMSFFYPDNDAAAATAEGDGSVAMAGNVNTGNITTGDAAPHLEERIALLERLLAEKERLIKVLMDGRG